MISEFLNTGLYYSVFLTAASAVLLLVLYFFRWRSSWISFFVWQAVFFCSALFAWSITGNLQAASIDFALNLVLAAVLYWLARVTSVYGLFFLISIIIPTFFGILWVVQLTSGALAYFDATGIWYILILLSGIFLGVVMFFNLALSAWSTISRFSPLYFPFVRRNKAWEEAQKAIQSYHPMVSIHVPCYSEPPDIVIQTLDSIAKLNYPNYEVIVLDNNTKDPALWKPLEEHCNKLGKQFRFYHYDSVKGAKAGALNIALKLTDPQAELVAVFDADYITVPEFLNKIVGFFANPKVGFVQTCQNFRGWEGSRYHTSCYYEYETGFGLEMPGKSEWDYSYPIGTMCVLRRSALDDIGGWAEWCLTEDSEIAVRLHAKGFEGYYLKDTFGRGLVPQLFEEYKIQRFRWSAGPVQQFQRYWRLFLPFFATPSQLSFAHKIGELFHSLPVFFNEALFIFLNIPLLGTTLYFSLVEGEVYILPVAIALMIPIAICRNLILGFIQSRLLGTTWINYFHLVMAGRSPNYTRRIAFYTACFSKNLTWKRTSKFKEETSSYRRALSASKAELQLALIYFIIVILISPAVHFFRPDAIFLIWLGLINQAISYFCAPIMAFLAEREIQTNHVKVLQRESEINIKNGNKA